MSRERKDRYGPPESRQLVFPISCIIINAFCKNRNTVEVKMLYGEVNSGACGGNIHCLLLSHRPQGSAVGNC